MQTGANHHCPTIGSDFGLSEIGQQLKIQLFFAFDISSLPTGIQQLRAARVSAEQTAAFEAYGVGNLGVIRTAHVLVDLVTPTVLLTGAPALHDLGVFSDSPDLGVKTVDVLVALEDDYNQRAVRSNSSQYRFRFDIAYEPEGVYNLVRFSCESVKLEVEYLIR